LVDGIFTFLWEGVPKGLQVHILKM
jgi:hypothetical protein